MSAPLKTRPIDDAARDGRYRLVFAPSCRSAVVRWDGRRWLFSSGRRLGFEPTEYLCG